MRPTFAQFMAQDLERIDPPIRRRCQAIEGRRLYLTGATGFYGKHLLSLLAHLAEQGVRFEVTAPSRDPDGFRALEPWTRHLSWLQLCRGDVTRECPGAGDFDLLLHAATDTSAASQRDATRLREQMSRANEQVIAFAQRQGVRRLLLCGSGAQYGPLTTAQSGGVMESSLAFGATRETGNVYADAKQAGEALAANFSRHSGCAVIATRGFAFVGPGLALDGHFAIGNFLRDALDGRDIKLATTGDAARSYLYGADLAVWLLLLLLEAPAGSVVNLGSDVPITVLELAQRVRSLIRPSLRVMAGAGTSSPERRYYLPSIRQAQAFGLAVWTDLDLAICRTALWYRSHEASGHGGTAS